MADSNGNDKPPPKKKYKPLSMESNADLENKPILSGSKADQTNCKEKPEKEKEENRTTKKEEPNKEE